MSVSSLPQGDTTTHYVWSSGLEGSKGNKKKAKNHFEEADKLHFSNSLTSTYQYMALFSSTFGTGDTQFILEHYTLSTTGL